MVIPLSSLVFSSLFFLEDVLPRIFCLIRVYIGLCASVRPASIHQNAFTPLEDLENGILILPPAAVIHNQCAWKAHILLRHWGLARPFFELTSKFRVVQARDGPWSLQNMIFQQRLKGIRSHFIGGSAIPISIFLLGSGNLSLLIAIFFPNFPASIAL